MNARTHGHKSMRKTSPTYSCWRNMRARCQQPGATNYENYGAKGVTVSARWDTFENFLADMGERPSLNHSLDRWPVREGNYEPGNVRWATRTEQNRNRKSVRPVVRSDGAVFPSIIEAAQATGVTRRAIEYAIAGASQTCAGYTWRHV